jgi:hypothetical protein
VRGRVRVRVFASLLLERGADVNIRDNQNETVLDMRRKERIKV